jgi:hypothetical protein
MAVAIVLIGLLALGLARVGGAAVARARARTAADAAALAGAAEGRDAAEAIAAANGGDLKSYDEHGADTRVVVEVGPAEASAKARRGLPQLAPPSAGG